MANWPALGGNEMITGKLPCPKCGAPSLDKDTPTQGRTCINCGKHIKGTHEVHLLIQANGKNIAKDYEDKGLKPTLHKWGISTKALYNIPEIIEIKSKYHKYQHIKRPANTIRKERSNGHLPQLPIFSNDWTSEVQLKWLSLYETILTKEDKTE